MSYISKYVCEYNDNVELSIYHQTFQSLFFYFVNLFKFLNLLNIESFIIIRILKKYISKLACELALIRNNKSFQSMLKMQGELARPAFYELSANRT